MIIARSLASSFVSCDKAGKFAPVIARAAQALDRRRRRCIESTIVLSLRRPILVGEERLMRLTRYTKEIKCAYEEYRLPILARRTDSFRR
jgi:hypothetical protein